MSGRRKIIWIVVVIIVIIVGAIVWYWYAKNDEKGATVPESAMGTIVANASMPTSSTRAAVPAGITAPDKGSVNAPSGVAVPVVQGPGDPVGNVSYRSFGISVQNAKFSPNTVVVNQGDTINLEITAIDASYAFTQPDYGFNAAITKGKTQTIQFQAIQSGNFTFYCASCGGPSKGPVGHIIVVASK